MVSQAGKYLYCIIGYGGNGEERAFGDVAPMGDDSGGDDSGGDDSGGHDSGSVYTVSHLGLAVVVSDTDSARHDVSRANMLAHQRVQERVLEEFTLLPVRFGSVANGVSPVDDLRRLLEKRQQEFERLLSEMEGKIELGLRALWKDEKAVFEEIVAGDNQIKGLRDSLLRDSLRGKPPAATHFERIRLGAMVKEALERRRKAEASVLLAPLRPIACRTVENPAIVDRAILNAAFLVEKRRGEEFDRAADLLDGEHGQRVSFKYIGPVPPYNFVNIVVNWKDL